MSKHGRLVWVGWLGVWLAAAQGGLAQEEVPARRNIPQSTVKTTRADRRDLAVTLYQQGFGLIEETRAFRLPQGLSRLQIQDVAEKIEPVSAQLSFSGGDNLPRMLEQSYEYDLAAPYLLASKYVGREVELYEKIDGQVKEKLIQAVLLKAGENGNVYLIENKVHLGHPGRLVLPDLPNLTWLQPTLAGLVSAAEAANYECHISYLSQGFNWSADYNARLADDEQSVALMGWATLENRSGLNLENVRPALVSGQVRRLFRADAPQEMHFQKMIVDAAEPQWKESPLFEYQFYDLNETVNLPNNQVKQINLLSQYRIPVKKLYQFENTVSPYRISESPRHKDEIQVALELENRKEEGLGRSLPPGKVLIRKSVQGREAIIGEDELEHVPAGKKFRLCIGGASDILGEHVQQSFTKISNNSFKADFKITVTNYKSEPVSVSLVEHMGADWQILKSSVPHSKPDARTAEFLLDVPAKQEASVEYTLKVTY